MNSHQQQATIAADAYRIQRHAIRRQASEQIAKEQQISQFEQARFESADDRDSFIEAKAFRDGYLAALFDRPTPETGDLTDRMREAIVNTVMGRVMNNPTLKAAAEACTQVARDYASRTPAASTGQVESGWLPMSECPDETIVRVKVGEGMSFLAKRTNIGAIDSDEQPCMSWVAEHEGKHPPCWTNGACWSVNAEDEMSMQPTGWRPLPEPPHDSLTAQDGHNDEEK